MFSYNEKISKRQVVRNYSISLMALAAWMVPQAISRETVAGVALSVAFFGILFYWSSRVVPPDSVFVKSACFAHYWILGTMMAHVTGLLVQEYLLTDTSILVILAWFYVVLFYNIYKGIECRMRVSEVLFPFFLFLAVFLCILLYGVVDFGKCLEFHWRWDGEIWKVGYQMFCFWSAGWSLWHWQKAVEKEQSTMVWKIWLALAATAAILCVLIYSIYGNRGHTGLMFPLGAAQTLAHFPGGVIGRTDALFVFVWLIGLFLLCSTLLSPITVRELNRREKYLFASILAASWAVAVQENCMDWLSALLYKVTTPLQILILLGCVFKGRKGIIRVLSILMVAAFFLVSCGQQELEKRGIATAIGIDPAKEEGKEGAYEITLVFGSALQADKEQELETFQTVVDSISEAVDRYGEVHQKDVDFNHLKQFYLSKDVMEAEEFGMILEEIQLDSAYSRGTSVYVTYGPAGEEALRKETPEEGMPIHYLLNAYYNHERVEIPMVNEEHLFRGSYLWEY